MAYPAQGALADDLGRFRRIAGYSGMRRGVYRRQGEMEAQVNAHTGNAGTVDEDEDTRFRHGGTYANTQ